MNEAARVLESFSELWAGGDLEERRRLLNLVLQRVWVKGERVSALMVKPAYHIVIIAADESEEDGGNKEPSTRQAEGGWLSGDDGGRTRIAIQGLLVGSVALAGLRDLDRGDSRGTHFKIVHLGPPEAPLSTSHHHNMHRYELVH